MWGRTDLEQYAHGLRSCRNFFVSQHGAAVSRPGTRKVMGQHFGNYSTEQRWLIPFVVADDDTYVLVFGEGVIQFIRNGTHVYNTPIYVSFSGQTVNFTVGQVVTASGGAHATIANVIDFGTSGAILTAAGFSGAVAAGETLLDALGGNGTVVAAAEDQLPVAPGNAPWRAPLEVAGTPYAAEDLPFLQYTQSGDVLTLTHPNYAPMELRYLGALSWTLTALSFARQQPYFRDTDTPYTATLPPQVFAGAGGLVVPTLSEPVREWQWKVTVVAQDTATGRKYETLPKLIDTYYLTNPDFPIAMPHLVVLYPDNVITLRRWTSAGLLFEPPGFDSFRPIAYNFYRGRGELFGFVGQTGDRDFVDIGGEPNYGIQPPLGTNPFEVYDTASVLVRTEKPAAVAYFQDRLVFGGTAERAAWMFFSATGDYINFDIHSVVHTADESLTFALAARKREEIHSFLALRRLLIFTNSSVWSIGGAAGAGGMSGSLEFDSVSVTLEEDIGAHQLPALVVNGVALYVRAKGQGVRALVSKPKADGGFFTGVDVSLIAQHLFLGNTRTSNVLNETLVPHILPKEIVSWCFAEDPWAVVWAVRGDGELLSLTFNEQQQTWAWARHDTDGRFLCVCSVPEGNEDAVYAVVQRTINGVTSTFVERMSPRVLDDRFFQDACVDCSTTLFVSGTWSTTITGLGYLEGKQVWVTAYGNQAQGPFTVTGGAITGVEEMTSYFIDFSSAPQWVLHVGLFFAAELETLDLATAAIRMKQKTVTQVGFEVDNAVGLVSGQDFNNMLPVETRDVSDSYSPVPTNNALVRTYVNGTWDENGRAVLRQTVPLPVTVYGITREVDIGG